MAGACVLVALSACDGSLGTQRCAFGPERVVADGTGSFIRAVALARRGRELTAAWTDASGTWVAPLGDDGAAPRRKVRVGPPAESLDLSAAPSGYTIAMLFPGDPIWAGGSAQTRALDRDGRPLGPPVKLGRAGCYSRGITIAGRERDGLVAWQDGTPGDLAIMVAAGAGEPIRLSPRDVDGCCPSFGLVDGQPVLVWSQHRLGPVPERAAVQALRFGAAGEREGPFTIVETEVDEPWPAIAEGPGGFGLIYRDRRRRDRYEQAYFVRADLGGHTLSRPVGVGRYNGRARAVLMNAGDLWASVSPRNLRKTLMLGFDRFALDGQRIGAQLHIFAHDIRFTDVDALTMGTRYVLLYSEDRPRQRVWLSQVRCR